MPAQKRRSHRTSRNDVSLCRERPDECHAHTEHQNQLDGLAHAAGTGMLHAVYPSSNCCPKGRAHQATYLLRSQVLIARLVVAVIKDREKRVLRDFDTAYLLHTFLPLFLLFQELSFSGDVATVALGRDVLAQRRDRL